MKGQWENKYSTESFFLSLKFCIKLIQKLNEKCHQQKLLFTSHYEELTRSTIPRYATYIKRGLLESEA